MDPLDQKLNKFISAFGCRDNDHVGLMNDEIVDLFLVPKVNSMRSLLHFLDV